MRLRLAVQRHGLPAVQVLWTLGAIRPPSALAGASLTVSQFLEQVNDIIPLESDDWGLEDYTVELGGFECFHFSDLSQTLKEDEVVCIRPLQTSDLRVRKFSGRHQISSDGKHLIDGVAFGRPFLQRADRPAVRIPPRKRRRITYDEEEDYGNGEQVNDRQIVVRAGFEDTDEVDVNDESEEDEDLALDDGEEDLDEELEDLHDDVRMNENDDEQLLVGGRRGERKRSTRSQIAEEGLGLRLLDDSGRKFNGVYSNPLLDYYGQPEIMNEASAITARKRHSQKHIRSFHTKPRACARDSSASLEHANRRSSDGSRKSVHFEDAKLDTPATLRESVDSDDSDDEDDSDFNADEVNESDKENTEPLLDTSSSSHDTSDSGSSTYSDSELSDGEQTSSESSSDCTSDSGPEQLHSTSSDKNHSVSGTSSSESLSSSSKGSESEKESNNVKGKLTLQGTTPNTSVEGTICSGANHVQTMAPPGEGKKQTRKRNQRRRESKKMKFLKEKGMLPLHATKADMQSIKQALDDTVKMALVREKEPLEDGNDQDAAFDTGTQAPISSKHSGGVDEEHEEKCSTAVGGLEELKGNNIEENSYSALPDSTEVAYGTTVLVPDSHPESTELGMAVGIDDRAPVETPSPINTSITSGTPAEDSRKRRARLDLASSKRLLFGSLGLRTPKTKEDESNLRAKLMKDVRPSRASQITTLAEANDDVAAECEDESWKEKISLRAVECCHEGIELSTPPFPFVQRWDPQQQGGCNTKKSKKRNKGKKRKRNDDVYYEDDLNRNTQDSAVRRKSHDSPIDQNRYEAEITKSPEISQGREQAQEQAQEQSVEDTNAAKDSLMQEASERAVTISQEEEVADLPDLPADLSVCPKLELNTSKVGDIVAFKEFHMSAETNWQPVFSEYLTAIVNEITEEGVFCMTLARRDQPATHIQYDEITGERLYSKFEMPGFSDEADQEDDSKREIPFEDLISPLLIQAADDKLDASANHQPDVSGSSLDQLSDTLMGEEGQRQTAGPLESLLDSTDQVCSNLVVEPIEQVRQESPGLISDAGWRSSLQLEINNGLKDHGDFIDRDNTASANHPSPKFHGFSSSSHGPSNNTTTLLAEVPSSASRIDTNVEVAERVPPRHSSDSRALSPTFVVETAVEYPSLPHTNNDSEDFQGQRQHRLASADTNHQISSEEPITPPPLRCQASRTGFTRAHDLNVNCPTKVLRTLDGMVDSEEEFPELFSQAFDMRMSQEVQIKAELSEDDDTEALAKQRSKSSGRLSSSENEEDAAWKPNWSDSDGEGNDDAESPQSLSQPSQFRSSSQLVDLTMSSDTAELPDHPYGHTDESDRYRPSSEPGRVSKPKVNRVPGVSRVTRERRKTKSR